MPSELAFLRLFPSFSLHSSQTSQSLISHNVFTKDLAACRDEAR